MRRYARRHHHRRRRRHYVHSAAAASGPPVHRPYQQHCTRFPLNTRKLKANHPPTHLSDTDVQDLSSYGYGYVHGGGGDSGCSSGCMWGSDVQYVTKTFTGLPTHTKVRTCHLLAYLRGDLPPTYPFPSLWNEISPLQTASDQPEPAPHSR